MRRHHENRMKFDFPRDGKQNQFTFLTKTIPSRSNRKAVTLPLIYHKSFMIHRGDRREQGNVLVSAEITLAVIAPENLAKLDSPLGVSRGGSAPFCWRSRNQEVPCESLVVKRSLTFLLQRKYPRDAGAGSHPAKETGLLKVS